jgi:hypothetical protein
MYRFTLVILARRHRSGAWRFEASWGKLFKRPYLKKNPSQKRTGGVAQGEDPEFKPQYHNNNNNCYYYYRIDFYIEAKILKAIGL